MCVFVYTHILTHIPVWSLNRWKNHSVLVFSLIIVAGAVSRNLRLVSMAAIPSLLTSHLPSIPMWQYEEKKSAVTPTLSI